ncbi:MAG: dTDP-4-dehydrorhamnose reductase, partial [Acidimicrobiales bacterium]
VTDPASVSRALSMARPDVVVNLAAYTAVDRAEDEVEACYAVNETGPALLSAACAETGAHLVTVSTDYVFDGTKGAAYVEGDAPNPLGVYGASKWAGEQRCAGRDTIVRTSWVMGVRGRSVVHVIAERARRGEPVRFVDDQRGTVTSASDLARVLVTMVRERPGGIWHVANSGDASWYDVAVHVGRLLGADGGFATPIATSELDPPPRARRPVRSDLDTSRLATRWRALPPWREAVARLLSDRVVA